MSLRVIYFKIWFANDNNRTCTTIPRFFSKCFSIYNQYYYNYLPEELCTLFCCTIKKKAQYTTGLMTHGLIDFFSHMRGIVKIIKALISSAINFHYFGSILKMINSVNACFYPSTKLFALYFFYRYICLCLFCADNYISKETHFEKHFKLKISSC